MDISELHKMNMVNQNTKVIPNYELNKERTSIILYFNNDKDLYIIGEVDNNYIHWASLTKTYENEKNEAIFNYIANEPFTIVSQTYLTGIPARYDLKDYYRAELRRIPENGAWSTPFGVHFSKEQIQNNGRFFADYVADFLNELHQMCYFREAGGRYEAMLDFWLSVLTKGESDYMYYQRIGSLPEMIKQEGYLRVSECEPIRNKYILICEKLGDMYNRYMNVVR